MHPIKIAGPQMNGREIQQERDDQHNADAGGVVRADLFGNQVHQGRLHHHGPQTRDELKPLVAGVMRI